MYKKTKKLKQKGVRVTTERLVRHFVYTFAVAEFLQVPLRKVRRELH